MPKLEHRKSRGGCQRCKKRKVKCDELRPSCGACCRHAVQCEYGRVLESPRNSLSERYPSKVISHASPKVSRGSATTSGLQMPMSVQSLLHPMPTPSTSTQDSPKPTVPAPLPLSTDPPRNILELRLTHHWASSAYTSASMNNTADYWRVHVPQLAFEHTYTLNSILALSAFRLALAVGTTDQQYLLRKARQYFEEALVGQRVALAGICEENAEAVFATSALLSVYALSALRDRDHLLEDSSIHGEQPTPFAGVLQWLHLASGSRTIWVQSRKWFIQNERMRALASEPELFTEDEVIFREENLDSFGSLLTWAAEYEYMTELDRRTYEKTIKYLGLVYRASTVDHDSPLSCVRRLIALPSRVPPKLRELVEEQRPRALCVLATYFGMIKLVNEDMPWNECIAERQIPMIWERVPVGWRECMRWPMKMIGREDEVGPPKVI